ncbi:MAG: pyridoxal-phosphate dependent enzyme [Pseudomonadales bacterium]|jgi:threonine dehydratase
MSISLYDIKAAHERIKPHIHMTPVVTSERLDEMTGCELFFKCENLQKAGAFKSRGAVNAVFSLPESKLERGVATHSSGNHGAALARAAALRGMNAYIVIPENAKSVKKDAILGYGAKIIECESTLKAREEMLEKVVLETKAHVVHPYDDDDVIAGQGTAALELMDQVANLDAIMTPVGGGGLLAGCAIAVHGQLACFAAEPEQADDAYRSLRSGKLVKNHVPNTICDGLQTTLGIRNFEIICGNVSEIFLVSENEIIDAMTLIWTRLKLVVEASSAVTFAAVLRNREIFSGQHVGLILTGGNVDLADLPF